MKARPWSVSYHRSEKDGRYYPHIIAGNGEITWAAPRGYAHPSSALKAVKRFLAQCAGAGFVLSLPKPGKVAAMKVAK